MGCPNCGDHGQRVTYHGTLPYYTLAGEKSQSKFGEFRMRICDSRGTKVVTVGMDRKYTTFTAQKFGLTTFKRQE